MSANPSTRPLAMTDLVLGKARQANNSNPQAIEAITPLISRIKESETKLQDAKTPKAVNLAMTDYKKAMPTISELEQAAAHFPGLSRMELAPLLGLTTPEQTDKLVALDIPNEKIVHGEETMNKFITEENDDNQSTT